MQIDRRPIPQRLRRPEHHGSRRDPDDRDFLRGPNALLLAGPPKCPAPRPHALRGRTSQAIRVEA